MCGIFGLIIKPNTSFPDNNVRETLLRIARLSESRGKDSSGLAVRLAAQQEIVTIKGDIPVTTLLKSNGFNTAIQTALNNYRKHDGFAAFGHARLVTNGSQLNEENNQPVIKDKILAIHNGIIVNVDELWAQHPELTRSYSIDTEVIPALLREALTREKDIADSSRSAFSKLEGTFSVAAMFADLNQFLLATNNGSLYYITDNKNYVVFASEAFFLQQLMKQKCFQPFDSIGGVIQLNAGKALIVDLENLRLDSFSLSQKSQSIPQQITKPFSINKIILNNSNNKNEVVIDPAIYINRAKEKHLLDLLEYNIDSIGALKRCTRCLLPETFPFIEYDHVGVCNYCINYQKKNKSNSIDELKNLVEPYRNKNGKPDCLVPFSGGRDSTFSLHFIKQELELNPIAFTYDWGMVTDLARRNAARVCGKLGVENIIVAADIHLKRENIRKNVLAWLKNPHLGMVPLFMAGDKYFFHFSNKILQQTGLKLSIWGSNPFENTDFKSGFTGIDPVFNKKRIDDIKLFSKLKLASFFGKQYLSNPAYINSSLSDTIGSFKSRYLTKRYGYLQLFDYIVWDEKEVESLIFSEYDWEKSIDTKSTWRIGDGTAAFYNYIYYTVAGFSEFDTFRSNQIREGQMAREVGMRLVNEENIPRFETLRWYFEIIGVDFKQVIKVINSIPKLYRV